MKAFLLPFLLLTISIAQSGTAPAPPDFSEGFKRLASMGMPALDPTAKWSKLPRQFSGDGWDYEMNQMLEKTKGNGWAVPAGTGTTRVVSAGGLEFSGNEDESGSSKKKPTTYPEADIGKDIETITKILAKSKEEANRYASGREVVMGGKLLLLATQFHQTSHTTDANTLAAAIFDRWPSRERVLDAAITTIADHQLGQISLKFFSSADWSAYHKELVSLQAKFPRGWATGPALEVILPQIARQAAGENPAPPALPNVTLDARALAAIASLTEKPSAYSSKSSDDELLKLYGMDLSDIPVSRRATILAALRQRQGGDNLNLSSFWILKDPGDKPGNSPTSSLISLGIDALPALAALLDDPYLTPFPNDRNGRSSFYSSSDSEEERIQEAYQNMPRPISRGDIASMLLINNLPQGENRNGEKMDSETLRDLALDFWKAHRKATPDELALIFLSAGDRSQQSQVVDMLTKSKDPKTQQALEKHILSSENAINHYQIVKAYLSTRKAAAKPFFDAYAKLIREQTPESDDDNGGNDLPWEVRDLGGPAKIIKSLESFVGGKSFRAIAKDIARGKPEDVDSGIRSLINVMESEAPTKQLYALLEGAVSTDNPVVRGKFLRLVGRIAWERSAGDETGEEEESAPTPLRKLPAAEIKAWRKLLADKRPVSESQKVPSPGSTVEEAGIVALCYSVSPHRYYAVYQAAPILKRKPRDILREDAEAILSAKPLATLPDASRVSPERLRAIVNAAAAKAPAEIPALLDPLPPDERAAWAHWLQNPEDLEIPKSVADLKTLVFRRSSENPNNYQMLTDTAPIQPGFTLTADSIQKAIQTFATEIDKRSLSTIWIKPVEFGPGMETMAARFPPPPEKPDQSGMPPICVSAFSSLCIALKQHESASGCILLAIGSGDRGDMWATAWTVENGKATSTDEDTEAQIKEVFTQVNNSQIPGLYYSIQFLSKADAGKIQTYVDQYQKNGPEDALQLLPDL